MKKLSRTMDKIPLGIPNLIACIRASISGLGLLLAAVGITLDARAESWVLRASGSSGAAGKTILVSYYEDLDYHNGQYIRWRAQARPSGDIYPGFILFAQYFRGSSLLAFTEWNTNQQDLVWNLGPDIVLEGTRQEINFAVNVMPHNPFVTTSVGKVSWQAGFALDYVDLDERRLDKNTRGDPVQLATGVESSHRPLFRFSGARNWDFTISYNSHFARSYTGLTGRFPLGRGWTHNFEASILTGAEIGSLLYWDQYRYSVIYHDPQEQDPNLYLLSGDIGRYRTLRFLPDGTKLLTHQDRSTWLFSATGQLIETRDPQGRKLVLAYDASVFPHRLSGITDPVSGVGLTLAYDAAGILQRITDSAGASVQFVQSATDYTLTRITNQNGAATSYAYDQFAQLTTLTDHAGQTLTANTTTLGKVTAQADGVAGHPAHGFSYNGTVTTYTDRNGKASVHTFDANYNLLSERDALNRTTTYTYDSANLITSVTDPLGRVTRYTYDAQGNMLTLTDPAGKVTTFTYDARNNLLTTTDAAGQVTTRTYDASNNLLTLTDALGRTTTWTYDANSLPLTTTLPGRGVSRYTYTAGRLATSTDPNGVVTRFGYDAAGRLLYREDALGQRVSFTYDAIGNILTTTNALNQTTTYAYDHRNRVTRLTEPTGAVTAYTYDNNGNLLTATNALGQVTTYTYDGEDRLKTVQDALNRITTYHYDDAGQLTSVVDPAGNVTAYEYDAAGQLTAVVDALGRRTASGYDARGLLTSVTDPLSRTASFGYDDVGRRTSATDPLNRVTNFQYDALDRLKQLTDPGSLVAAQGFDADGNRTSLTNPAANATAFTYDAGGWLTSATTPEGRVSTYTYDSRGLLATAVEPSGQVTSFSYDSAQRLSSTTDAVGPISLARDAAGRVLSVSENGRTLTRVYDLLGRLTSFTDDDGNVIGYQYDGLGRLARLTYPDGKQVGYAYDAAGRLSTVTDWAARVTTYGYDAVGRVTQVRRPNGTRQTRTYDAAGQLTQLTELASDGFTVIYSGTHSYDAAGQLIGETVLPGLAPVSVDLTQTFDRDNRLLTHQGAATTFDADGNLLSIASGVAPASYTYDARNRLTGAGGLGYVYDAENRRVALTDASGTTHYAINPNAVLDQVLVRTAPDGTKTFYVYGLGLLHEETGGSVRYYHHDRRGDTVALTNGSGTVTDRASYGVYGELLSRTGTTNTPFLFNGRWGVQTDGNGLYYHRARYYHPQLRRFLNQDTVLGSITTSASLNRFAYGNGNPVTAIDPFGLASENDSPYGNIQAGRSGFAYFLSGIAAAIRYYNGADCGEVKAEFLFGRGDSAVGPFQSGARLVRVAALLSLFVGIGEVEAVGLAAKSVTNAVPTTMARVIPGKGPFPTLGPPGRADVFITAADDIAGLTPAQISQRLTIPASDTFTIIRFPTPGSGVASPILRPDPGFIGGGRTLGGAREFVIPNGPIPPGATTTILGP
jgi:RHS repeat-associated protein